MPVVDTAIENPAERLVKGLGGRLAVAARFDVSVEAVRLWLRRWIPEDRALEVEEATRGSEFAITATEVLHYARQRRGAGAQAPGED